VALERAVRAFDPWPGTWFELAGERVKVLAAAVAAPAAPGAEPGTVLDAHLTIACGAGALRLLRLQRPGRAPQETEAFLRGHAIAAGTLLPCPATS
jgi:methionyl-tRNA formyltransferase